MQRGPLLKTLFLGFPETFKTIVFLKIPWKIYKTTFQNHADSIQSSCYFNKMSLLQTFSWQVSNYFREQSQETLFLESDFVKVRSSGLQACNVKEKGAVLHKGLFEISEIQNTLFFLSTSKKYLSTMELLVRQAVDCSRPNLSKRLLSYVLFFQDNFKCFWCSYFNTPSWKPL